VKSSLNPSPVGAAATLTATVQPSTATGTVQILDGTTSLGTPTISSGSAAVTVSTLAVGSHSITAAYSGDASNAKSTSSPFIQNVSKATPSVLLTAQPNPGVFGQNVAFTVTISPPAATGTVTLSEAGKAVGSPITLSGGTGATTTNSLTVGSHTVTATYPGDANFSGASGNFTETIGKAPVTVTVTATKPVATAAVPPTTFTATIAPAGATGTVTFTASPDTPPLTSGPVTVAAGIATWVVTVPDTLQTITAVYSGDANFQSGTGTVNVGG
jgi:large repetitive protein